MPTRRPTVDYLGGHPPSPAIRNWPLYFVPVHVHRATSRQSTTAACRRTTCACSTGADGRAVAPSRGLDALSSSPAANSSRSAQLSPGFHLPARRPARRPGDVARVLGPNQRGPPDHGQRRHGPWTAAGCSIIGPRLHSSRDLEDGAALRLDKLMSTIGSIGEASPLAVAKISPAIRHLSFIETGGQPLMLISTAKALGAHQYAVFPGHSAAAAFARAPRISSSHPPSTFRADRPSSVASNNLPVPSSPSSYVRLIIRRDISSLARSSADAPA